MDKSLHDLVENYLEITPQLHGKTRPPARSAAANFARCLCRVFPRNFGVIFNRIVQTFVHLPYLSFQAPRGGRCAAGAARWALRDGRGGRRATGSAPRCRKAI